MSDHGEQMAGGIEGEPCEQIENDAIAGEISDVSVAKAETTGDGTPPRTDELAKSHARSTGPRTAEGKRRSSMNAMKKGFFSQELIRSQAHLSKEERRTYLRILGGLTEAWNPVGPDEHMLLELMAIQAYQYIRFLRLTSASRADFSLDLGRVPKFESRNDQQFKIWLHDLPPLEDLEKLQRIEQHIWKSYFRAQSELERRQAIRQGEKALPRFALDVNAQ